MAVIEVNHGFLREVASAISYYCTKQDLEMQFADSEIKSMLYSDWLGSDAVEFGKTWESVDDANSTTVKFRDSLKNFGESITACANKYKNAQADTYDAAHWLPKHIVW